MRLHGVIVCLLICVLAGWIALTPVPVFVLTAAETNTRLACVPVASGDEIVYHSINSMFHVPVQEYLRVLDDGALQSFQLITTPDVVYYYGLESFTWLDDTMVRATPRDMRYRDIRIKVGVGARGQQRIVVRGREIILGDWVELGQAVIARVESTPRVLACW
jgi:hypothetical protein